MVDARGFSCPMPVVMVQKEVKKNAPDTLDVLVDNQCAVDNVTRFASNQRGFSGAVFAQKRINLAFFDLDCHIIVGHNSWESFGNVPHLYNVI